MFCVVETLVNDKVAVLKLLYMLPSVVDEMVVQLLPLSEERCQKYSYLAESPAYITTPKVVLLPEHRDEFEG